MPKVEISKLDHTDVRNFVTATGVQSEKSFADELACGISDRRDARSIIVGERSLDENGARQEAATKNIVFQKGVNSRRCGRIGKHHGGNGILSL